MCWWLNGGSELVAVDREGEGEGVKEKDGWVCWWLSGGPDLVTVFRHAEGELGQGVE